MVTMVTLTEICLLFVAVYALYWFIDWLIRRPRIPGLLHRYILITGCDSGFGNMLARRLDRMGCRVFAACLTRKGLSELKKVTSDRVTTLIMNVADQDSVRQAYHTIGEKLPDSLGLWAVVNNAGVAGARGPLEWLTKEDYQKVLDVNLMGLIDVTTVFLPLVKKAKGRVVNMASMLGRFSLTGCAPYCISKYGVEAFSDSLRQQMRHFQVQVSIIEPGFFRTGITSPEDSVDSLQQTWLQASEGSKAEYGEQFLEDSIRSVQESLGSGIVSSKTGLVVDAYIHALTARYPRSRYLVGWDAQLVVGPLAMLPAFFSDLLMRYKLRHCVPDVARNS